MEIVAKILWYMIYPVKFVLIYQVLLSVVLSLVLFTLLSLELLVGYFSAFMEIVAAISLV